MLGRYDNFPDVIHGRALFKCQSSVREVQQVILCSLCRLTHAREDCRLNIIASHLSDCEVGFEFGIAEDTVFSYLDEQEFKRFEKCIDKKELPMMDFFCVVYYHTISENGKRVPLKFDYHLIRFTFHLNSVELWTHHERGPRHLPPEDFVNFIINNINEELKRRS